MKDLLKILILSVIFTVLIFIVNSVFFMGKTEIDYIEENYIEPVVKEKEDDYLSGQEEQNSYDIINQESEKRVKFFFLYSPISYRDKVEDIKNYIKETLQSQIVNKKVENLKIEFNENYIDTRGKMIKGTIRLFAPDQIQENESFAVFMHELGHFIDLYYLEKQVSFDLSDVFYDISWDSVKVLKEKQTETDFVSGYAMTNKYEDFAESFIYFTLHNEQFLEKTKKSDQLKDKYNFFGKYIFKNKEFFRTAFSEAVVNNYYWDITKIDYDLEKFLQYLEK